MELVMKDSKSRSSNKSGGDEYHKNCKLTKAATAPKGRMNQPKGSGDHNTKPRYAKKQKLGKTNFTDIEF
jgi:hypothetical protein